MLNITAQCGAEGAKSYFAKSDYYSEGQELVGEWGGKGAVLLGQFGRVDKHAFNLLCDNINPITHEPLTLMTRSERRVGYDFTWSAPKSVSVVYAMTGDERLVQAFLDSIRQTMKEMEAEMQTRVRKGGAQGNRTTANMIWAEFVHLTSRPVGGLPCPQLHAHLFCFNGTYDKQEDAWKAGQFGKIKQDAYYWQAVQQARFARNLQGLGYATRKTKDAFEIAGVPESSLKKFSLRTALIDQVARDLKIIDPAKKAKLPEISYPALVKSWDAMLEPHEREAIEKARGVAAIVPERNDTHLDYAKDHLFERSSVNAERRVLAEALRHGVGEVTPEGIRQAADAGGLLKQVEEGQTWVTTPQVLAEERAMLAFASQGKGTCRPFVMGTPTLRDERLNPDQRRAVEHLLSSADRVMIVRGFSGTGKTTLTTEAVSQIENAGKPVVMLAPSAQASRGVLRDEGFASADTLARFLVDEKMQQTAQHGVIWLDEASLVGAKSMASLFDLAAKLDARVVLVGDKGQLGSVERGSPLRVLEDLAGLKVAEVTDIRRQTGEYREAAGLLARGNTAAGLAKLDSLGWVKLMPQQDPYAPLASEYVAATARGESTLIVCPTHVEGAKVTAEVRNQLRSAGRLSSDEHELPRLVPLHWTQAERGDKPHYGGGEILQFHRKVGEFAAGERRSADEVLRKLSDKVARCFAAYTSDSIRLAEGDSVRITANGKTKDGKHRLNNGDVLTVKGFTPSGDVVDHRGWVIPKDFGHLAYGYVNTGQAAQGRTVDRVLIAQSAMSAAAASRENFYVAVTRGRKSATIYTDDKRELLAAVTRNQPRRSATELMAGKRAAPRGRLRRGYDALRRALIAAKRMVHETLQPQREMAYAR